MSYENVLTENRDGVLWLTVNRPEKLNALNRNTMNEIEAAINSAGNDDQVWAVVITGAGEKAFVAGADIGELNTLGPVEAKEFALRGQSIFRQIERLTKPVVAAVNGFAFGGGCELAMACHLRVATNNAVFGQPEVKLGLIPGYAGTQRLPRLVGKGKAKELIFTGQRLDAQEALKIGLVNKICDQKDLSDECKKMADMICETGPIAIEQAKFAINYGMETDIQTGLAIESNAYWVCIPTEDRLEGLAAFKEKRKPVYKGK